MLKEKRQEIIKAVKDHRLFFQANAEKLDIFQGNLLPYVDAILRTSLSIEYYTAIKDRILPINILQRFINKVSVSYNKPPVRKAGNEQATAFLEFYEKWLDINTSGSVADQYSNLFKGFAWEPYINKEGEPALRELPFDRFLVISDSEENPEEETIFVKIINGDCDKEDKILLFVYTDDEFDAFYMNGEQADEHLIDNLGVNVVGTIPFIYGKRQKNKLIPTQDTDMLAITKAVPVMLTDAAGAQMFQCFTILYGIDVSFENAKLSPNIIWNIKSDKESDKAPQIGSIKPEASTDEVINFVVNIFVMWLETKGIRVGSMGNVDATNAASGFSKIIDEMDVHKVVNTSMDWFTKDEKELWNKKLPKIHNYWIQNGLINLETVKDVPTPILVAPEITIEFERPKPMTSRSEEISHVKEELALGTMTQEQAIKVLHPSYTPEQIKEVLDAKNKKDAENAVDANEDSDTEKPETKSTGDVG